MIEWRKIWHKVLFRVGVRTYFQSYFRGAGYLYATEDGFIVHENHPQARWFWGVCNYVYDRDTQKTIRLSKHIRWQLGKKRDIKS